MKRRLRNINLMLITVLTAICGTRAYFVDISEEKISAKAAVMELEISDPHFSNIPEVIDEDSEIFFSFDVKNNGTVPVYLSEELTYWVNGNVVNTGSDINNLKTVKESNGLDENEDDDTERKVIIESVKNENYSKCRIGVNEVSKLTYKITFPKADYLTEDRISIMGNVKYTASTGERESQGFIYGPVVVEFDLPEMPLHTVKRRNDILENNIIEEMYQLENQDAPDRMYIENEALSVHDDFLNENTESDVDNIEPALFINTQSEITKTEDDMYQIATFSEIVN